MNFSINKELHSVPWVLSAGYFSWSSVFSLSQIACAVPLCILVNGLLYPPPFLPLLRICGNNNHCMFYLESFYQDKISNRHKERFRCEKLSVCVSGKESFPGFLLGMWLPSALIRLMFRKLENWRVEQRVKAGLEQLNVEVYSDT